MEEVEVEKRVVSIPEGVKVILKNNLMEVSGPLGTLLEDFSHTPVKIELNNNKEVIVYAYWPRVKEAAIVGTVASLIKNLIKGVTKGFTYKLKVVYSHFPVTIKINENEKKVIIENFIGEKSPRIAKIVGDVKVKVKADDVIVQGLNLKDVSQTASNIEQATKIKKKDQRVFLDGIYIYERKEGLENGEA